MKYLCSSSKDCFDYRYVFKQTQQCEATFQQNTTHCVSLKWLGEWHCLIVIRRFLSQVSQTHCKSSSGEELLGKLSQKTLEEPLSF